MMQTAANEHWKTVAKAAIDPDKVSPPDHPGDFGWANDDPHVAIEIGDMFYRYRILPRAGGWDDQLEKDRHDIKLYLRGLSYHMHVEHEKKQNALRQERNARQRK